MSMFVVQRDLPVITPEMLTSAGLRARTCCAELTAEGKEVKWIRSFFLPETAQTHCYFEAADASLVEQANQRANIPFTKISQVVEMTPEGI
ncbi:MAG: DUF4242 domain-containing protein [Bryobacteraceae bacterium]|nr:DUF4242 domain-containing protein [Bryobacteraceae bacterium]